MCQFTAQPSNAAEALAAVRAGLEFLAAADATGLTRAEQADCLRGLAAAESVHLAATARMLHAFDASDGFAAEGQISVRAWLRWQTQVTNAAAGAAVAWQRRMYLHPGIAAALADGAISPSYARQVCDWTDRIPEVDRHRADDVLLEAAAAGAELADLARLAEEIARRCAGPDTDDGDESFARRRLRLDRHWRGWAKLDADLTPQAAAALRAVLDSLNAKAGPEDERTQQQRDHDALEEACRSLVAGGLPDRAGQPTQIQLVMTLDQLTGGRPDTAEPLVVDGWDAPAPPGADCDAAISPVVVGRVDPDVLDQLTGPRLPGTGPAIRGGAVTTVEAMAARAARRLTVAQAVALLSGPGGLASLLRAGQFPGPAGAISLPLDLGQPTEVIPPWLRRAIIRRDRHCRFPGCQRRPAACQVHHLVPRSEGGTTSLWNCVLLCPFHHLIAVHRWGWQLMLNPDGTTTATHPYWPALHSHAPPTAVA